MVVVVTVEGAIEFPGAMGVEKGALEVVAAGVAPGNTIVTGDAAGGGGGGGGGSAIATGATVSESRR